MVYRTILHLFINCYNWCYFPSFKKKISVITVFLLTEVLFLVRFVVMLVTRMSTYIEPLMLLIWDNIGLSCWLNRSNEQTQQVGRVTRDGVPELLYSSPHHSLLTLNVQGPSYLGLTRSISWLLMSWLLMPKGHQQPWYWLCRICKSWSYFRKEFKYLCHINVE